MWWIRRYLFADIAVVRSIWLSRVVLLLLAFDVWLNNVSHAGRYGAGGFNVAHFAWMDAWLPMPSAALYSSVSLLTGVLALFVALRGGGRAMLGLICLLYTYSWSMSMLDSYQHHVLLSWILLCLVFLPEGALATFSEKKLTQPSPPQGGWALWRRWSGETDEGACFSMMPLDTPPPKRQEGVIKGQAWGVVLLVLIAAVVYAFTAVNKSEGGWEANLRALFSGSAAFRGFRSALQSIPDGVFWAGMTVASIGVQLQVALGYVLVPLGDRVRPRLSRWGWVVRGLLFLGILAAVGFHASVEGLMRLDIGWFSYYMIALAFVAMAPAGLLEGLARLWVGLRRAFSPKIGEIPRSVCAIWTVVVGALAFGILHSLDLPGDRWVGWGTLGAIVLFAMPAWRKNKVMLRDVLALGIVFVCLWATVNASSVRYDLYRMWGGDLYRRGEYKASLSIYRKGERYAPAGQSRAKKIRQIERILRSQGDPNP